jgi:effector-binding domain-containing protein
METIEFKDLEPLKVAALRVKNSRSIEEHFKQLLTWLKRRGIQPRKKLAIFYDKLSEFDPNRATEYEVCFVIKETVEGDEIVQIKELPPQRVAAITHYGPYETILSTYKTLLEQIKGKGYVVGDPRREIYIVYASLENEGDPKNYAKEIQFPIGNQNFAQTLFTALGNWMFPHFFVVFQWALLLTGVMSLLNFAIVTPGSTADGTLKVVMLSHLWVLLFSIMLSFLFYENKHRGLAEKCIFGMSILTTLFSAFNFSLHFVNDFLMLMWVTEIVAWTLYLVIFAISVYKILVTLLTPILRRFLKP